MAYVERECCLCFAESSLVGLVALSRHCKHSLCKSCFCNFLSRLLLPLNLATTNAIRLANATVCGADDEPTVLQQNISVPLQLLRCPFACDQPLCVDQLSLEFLQNEIKQLLFNVSKLGDKGTLYSLRTALEHTHMGPRDMWMAPELECVGASCRHTIRNAAPTMAGIIDDDQAQGGSQRLEEDDGTEDIHSSAPERSSKISLRCGHVYCNTCARLTSTPEALVATFLKRHPYTCSADASCELPAWAPLLCPRCHAHDVAFARARSHHRPHRHHHADAAFADDEPHTKSLEAEYASPGDWCKVTPSPTLLCELPLEAQAGVNAVFRDAIAHRREVQRASCRWEQFPHSVHDPLNEVFCPECIYPCLRDAPRFDAATGLRGTGLPAQWPCSKGACPGCDAVLCLVCLRLAALDSLAVAPGHFGASDIASCDGSCHASDIIVHSHMPNPAERSSGLLCVDFGDADALNEQSSHRDVPGPGAPASQGTPATETDIVTFCTRTPAPLGGPEPSPVFYINDDKGTLLSLPPTGGDMHDHGSVVGRSCTAEHLCVDVADGVVLAVWGPHGPRPFQQRVFSTHDIFVLDLSFAAPLSSPDAQETALVPDTASASLPLRPAFGGADSPQVPHIPHSAGLSGAFSRDLPSVPPLPLAPPGLTGSPLLFPMFAAGSSSGSPVVSPRGTRGQRPPVAARSPTRHLCPAPTSPQAPWMVAWCQRGHTRRGARRAATRWTRITAALCASRGLLRCHGSMLVWAVMHCRCPHHRSRTPCTTPRSLRAEATLGPLLGAGLPASAAGVCQSPGGNAPCSCRLGRW
jgi:hypothetical protein